MRPYIDVAGKGVAVTERRRTSEPEREPDVEGTGVALEASFGELAESDLLDLVTEEFQRQSEVPPCEEKTRVLCRVITGFLRTTPALLGSMERTREMAVIAFVSACPSWFETAIDDYPLVPAMLDDAFHQREIPAPPPPAIEMLSRIAVGIMRSKGAPRTRTAQLAMADWMASLYLAAED